MSIAAIIIILCNIICTPQTSNISNKFASCIAMAVVSPILVSSLLIISEFSSQLEDQSILNVLNILDALILFSFHTIHTGFFSYRNAILVKGFSANFFTNIMHVVLFKFCMLYAAVICGIVICEYFISGSTQMSICYMYLFGYLIGNTFDLVIFRFIYLKMKKINVVFMRKDVDPDMNHDLLNKSAHSIKNTEDYVRKLFVGAMIRIPFATCLGITCLIIFRNFSFRNAVAVLFAPKFICCLSVLDMQIRLYKSNFCQNSDESVSPAAIKVSTASVPTRSAPNSVVVTVGPSGKTSGVRRSRTERVVPEIKEDNDAV